MQNRSSCKLYCLDLTPFLQAGLWCALLPALTPARAARVRACRREADAARLAGAGWLLDHALTRENIPPAARVFLQNEWGKPFLKDVPLAFSLSHAGHYAVCAVGASPLGVDIESPRCTMALAERQFHAQELSFLHTLSEAEQPDALLRLWTAKEAFLKAIGRGLSLPLDAFSVELSPSGAQLCQTLCPSSLLLHEYRLEEFRLCLCTPDARPVLQKITPAVSFSQ